MQTTHTGGRTGFAVLPAAMTAVGVMFAMGLFLSMRVASLRPLGRDAALRGTLDLALDSGLEEACAGAELAMPALPARGVPVALPPGAPRSIPVPATGACFAADGIDLQPAQLTWSDVRISFEDGAPLAVGIVQIELTARATSVRRTVRTRRYFVIEPSGISIQSRDLGRMVGDA